MRLPVWRSLPPLVLLLVAQVALAAPHVFWVSDPVRPGEAVVVIGDGLAGAQVRVGPLATRALQPVPTIQPANGSLKFVVPAGLKPGLLACSLSTPEGQVERVLNAPQLWWAQGEGAVAPPPGARLRVFGKNLAVGRLSLALQGPKSLRLAASGDDYCLSATLPRDLPPGAYTVAVEAVPGEREAASNALALQVAAAPRWPDKVYNVRDFGAEGQGQTDDTVAVNDALAAAEKAGGGVVYFPRGRYKVTETLVLPRFVTLRGEARERVNILWPDVKDALPMQLRGTNSFAIEDLTFYCGNYSRFLVAEDRQATAGGVRLSKVTIRADRYRSHMTPDEVDRRLRSGGGNQCPLLTLGGADVRITDCDLYSSGMVFWLSRLRGAYIAGNTLSNGRWGWYCLSGNDGVIFERNTIVGGDLMATGGGLNTLDGSMVSRYVYYAHNTLRTMFGWDREAMTSDAGGGAYFGKAAALEGATVTLAEDPKGPDNWLGGYLYIMDGKGAGQYRMVKACEGRRVTLDRAFEVPPDETSMLSWCAYQGRCLFLDNDFTDAGVALQLYGNAIEHILAGNRSTRTAGFHNFGMMYSAGVQPNWYIQWLDNEIREGNVYWGDHDNWRLSGEAHLGVYAFPPADNWQTPLTLATMVRRNRLDNNAHIMLGCEWSGYGNTSRKGRHIRDVLVENNAVSEAEQGIFVFDTCEGLVLRGNRFTKVRRPLDGPGLGRAFVTPSERAGALAQTLQTLAADMGVKSDILGETKLKSLLAEMGKLPEGSPDATRYQGEAMRSLLVAVAKARPEGLPLKTVAPYLGLEAVMPWSAPLHNHLQSRTDGGASQLDINLTSSGVYPEPLTVTAELQPPAGWQASPSAAVQVDAKTPGKVSIPVVVAPGAWAANEIPVTFSVKIADQTLKVTQTIRVGSGFITRWMALGPFTNKSGQALDRTILPPDEAVDLGGEYDGATGKVKWFALGGAEFDNGFWPNLGRALKTDKGGTGYLLACLNSATALPAELRLVSSGGVAVSVNGEVAGSTDKPGEFRLPIALKSGDNVLLLKLTTPAGEWKELCEVGPVAGGPPLNGGHGDRADGLRRTRVLRPAQARRDVGGWRGSLRGRGGLEASLGR